MTAEVGPAYGPQVKLLRPVVSKQDASQGASEADAAEVARHMAGRGLRGDDRGACYVLTNHEGLSGPAPWD